MKKLIYLSQLFFLANCVAHSSNSNDFVNFTGNSFNLYIEERSAQEDGQFSQAALIICQNDKCRNPLRTKDEKSEFLFVDYQNVYSKEIRKNSDKKRLQTVLVGASLLAGIFSVFFYIKSDTTRKILAKKFEELTDLIDSGKHSEKLEENVSKLLKREKITTNTFYGSEVMLVGTSLTSLLPNITENIDFQDNKHFLADLLVHRKEIVVTRSELNQLLNFIIKVVPAKIEPAISHYLNSAVGV